jgi:hypothetical protein
MKLQKAMIFDSQIKWKDKLNECLPDEEMFVVSLAVNREYILESVS